MTTEEPANNTPPKKLALQFRPETSADHDYVESMTRRAFWNNYNPGCDEHYLLHVMRPHEDFLPELSVVAVHDTQIVGHIAYTKSKIVGQDGTKLDTVTFGPLTVDPPFQRRGIGKALVQHTSNLARERSYPAIIIFGDPNNYAGSGFRGGYNYGIGVGGGKYPTALLVLALKPEVLEGQTWTFSESSLFQVDPKEVEEYDAKFPPMEKAWKGSQEVFAILSGSFVDMDSNNTNE